MLWATKETDMAPTPIIPFKRGSTFAFMFAVPENMPNGFFKTRLPSAQIRKAMNSRPDGLIANIACFWADPATTRYLIVHHSLTDKWPLGNAEMDILFESATGEKLRSTTALFNIQRGITV